MSRLHATMPLLDAAYATDALHAAMLMPLLDGFR